MLVVKKWIKTYTRFQQVFSLVEKTDAVLGNTKQCRTFSDRCKGHWPLEKMVRKTELVLGAFSLHHLMDYLFFMKQIAYSVFDTAP